MPVACQEDLPQWRAAERSAAHFFFDSNRHEQVRMRCYVVLEEITVGQRSFAL